MEVFSASPALWCVTPMPVIPSDFSIVRYSSFFSCQLVKYDNIAVPLHLYRPSPTAVQTKNKLSVSLIKVNLSYFDLDTYTSSESV